VDQRCLLLEYLNITKNIDKKSNRSYIDHINKISQKGCEKKLPKCYSDEEREYIIRRLKEEAAKCLTQYGVRRTTVDELVKRVNIPKGTFYLFYKSKEILLFEVIQEQHDAINNGLAQALSKISVKDMSADTFTDLIFDFFKKTEEMPILRLLNTDEVELLVRKLPREVVEAHLQEDTGTIEKMLAMFPMKKKVDVKAISAAFHAIYFATLHKADIGEESYDEALRMLIYGVVKQIM
jgi:AcrR family transcriptional regulator